MKDIVLQPTFYEKFACLGGACKNHCCRNCWTVLFTKDEFRDIKRRIHTPKLKEIFQESFNIEKGKDVYTLKFNEKGLCKFFGEDGLCMMYGEVGPENMGYVCQIFPREYIRFVNTYERFLSVGCEEVVNLLIQEKDGIMLEVKETEIPKLTKKHAPFASPAGVVQNRYFHFWNEMKMLLLGVLQNRDYVFGERMVLLGMAAQKVEDAIQNKKSDDAVKEVIESFLRNMDEPANREVYKQFFQNIKKDGQKRALEVLSHHLIQKTEERDIVDRVMKKIDLKLKVSYPNGTDQPAETTFEFSMNKYQQAMKDFDEFLKGKEYWVENVILEGFLAEKGFYRLQGKSFWSNFAAMATTYSVFLFLWTCCLQKDSTQEEFVYVTSQIARSMFHNVDHTKYLEEQLKKTESDTLAHIALLLL